MRFRLKTGSFQPVVPKVQMNGNGFNGATTVAIGAIGCEDVTHIRQAPAAIVVAAAAV
jgi:hypothetical protein